MLGKVGGRLAYSARGGQRGRAVLVAVAVAAFSTATWAAVGLWAAADSNKARDVLRSPVVSFQPSGDGVPIVGSSLPIVDGRQFEIVWFAPTEVAGPAEFDRRLPAPGEAFVSPALLDATGGAEGFSEAFGLDVSPDSGELRWDDLTAFAGEFLAFATVPAGRSLPVESHLVGFNRDGAVGPADPVDVSRLDDFSVPQRPVAVPYFVDERVPSPVTAAVAGGLLLVVPGLVVLALGLASRSDARSDRRAALRQLGADRPAIAWVDAVEVSAVSVPVAAVASLCAWLGLGSLSSVPAGDLVPRRGDLQPSLAVSAAVLAGVLLLPGLAAAAVPARAGRHGRPGRRGAAGLTPLVVFVPLVVAVAGTAVPSDLRPLPFVAVCVSVAAVLPWLARGVVPVVGSLLDDDGSASRLVSARRLARVDQPAATILRIAVAATVVLAVIAAMTLRAAFPSESTRLGPPGTVVATWPDASGPQVERLQSAVPDVPLAAVSGAHVVVDDCAQLSRLIGAGPDACRSDMESVLDRARSSPLRQLGDVGISDLSELGAVSRVVAVVGGDGEYEAFQAEVTAQLGPAQVLGWEQLGPHPFADWVTAVGVWSVTVIAIGLVVVLANVVRFPSRSDRALAALAIRSSTQRAVLRWSMFPVAAGGVLVGSGYAALVVSAGEVAEITSSDTRTLAVAAGCVLAVMLAAIEVGIAFAVRSLDDPFPVPARASARRKNVPPGA